MHDLDRDGMPDFLIWTGFGDCMSGCTLTIGGLQPGNEVILEPGAVWASALDWDDPIDASAEYGSYGAMAALSGGGPPWCVGPWCEGLHTRFLGVRLMVDGATHYAWIRTYGTLVGDYGYESDPEIPIAAGAGYPCAPDVNGDGVIDLADLAILLGHFGQGPMPPQDLEAGDIDNDDDVDLHDLVELLSAFGRECN